MPSRPDDACGGCRAFVCGVDRANRIDHRRTHVPDAQITIRLIKNSLAIRFTFGIRFSPVHADCLPRIAFDSWHAHPDARRTTGVVPRLNLIGQLLGCLCRIAGRKTDVGPVSSCLRKVEPIFMQWHKERKILHNGLCGQGCSVRCCQDCDCPGVLPLGILSH